jgi:hypothetical protein
MVWALAVARPTLGRIPTPALGRERVDAAGSALLLVALVPGCSP